MKVGIWYLLAGGVFLSLFSPPCLRASIEGQKLTIGGTGENGPYFYGTFDAAGFSDWIYYGYSPDHPHSYHELLSGEWGAAICYDGIATDPIDPNEPQDRKAMWLTRMFEYPDWLTNSTFTVSGLCTAWNTPANPTPGMNTGQSVITNGVVEITIDYEIVDLGALGTARSPMSYLVDPDISMYGVMYSDRFIFIQTYNIKNVDPNEQTLTHLEFYQFLHSHGADEYAA